MSDSIYNVNFLSDQASRLMQETDFRFSDFSRLFDGFGHEQACELFNDILSEILNQALKNGKPAYSDQIHLASSGDFNLTLNIVGQKKEAEPVICANEFDMLLVSLLPQAFTIPCFSSDISPGQLYERPGALKKQPPVLVEPFKPVLCHAYRTLLDLDKAEREAPCLVIHSRPRGAVTWVFDEETLDPLTLTDNDLQKSRIQLAIRVIGEMGGKEYAGTLDDLARSDFDHFVRWEAAESVYKLDEERGIRLLQEYLVKDPSAAIAQAARQTLENLTGESREAAL